MTARSGLSRDGVPTGLSVVAKTYDDVTAFRVAAAHEECFGWFDAPERRPALPSADSNPSWGQTVMAAGSLVRSAAARAFRRRSRLIV
jgi:hypothetical protein